MATSQAFRFDECPVAKADEPKWRAMKEAFRGCVARLGQRECSRRMRVTKTMVGFYARELRAEIPPTHYVERLRWHVKDSAVDGSGYYKCCGAREGVVECVAGAECDDSYMDASAGIRGGTYARAPEAPDADPFALALGLQERSGPAVAKVLRCFSRDYVTAADANEALEALDALVRYALGLKPTLEKVKREGVSGISRGGR